MAVTKAKVEKPDKDENKVARGASGGFAPEGYGALELVKHGVIHEGVATRGKDAEEKLHKEAAAFQKSKLDFGKKVEAGNKAVADGNFDKNPVKEAVADQHKKEEAEAAKKPTAAGANTNLDSPAVAQSPAATVKEEKKDLEVKKVAELPKIEVKKDGK